MAYVFSCCKQKYFFNWWTICKELFLLQFVASRSLFVQDIRLSKGLIEASLGIWKFRFYRTYPIASVHIYVCTLLVQVIRFARVYGWQLHRCVLTVYCFMQSSLWVKCASRMTAAMSPYLSEFTWWSLQILQLTFMTPMRVFTRITLALFCADVTSYVVYWLYSSFAHQWALLLELHCRITTCSYLPS